MHTPVMLNECLEYLALKPDGVYLDATAGLGGHTGAIARQLAELGGSGFVLACDRDAESLETGQGKYLGSFLANSLSSEFVLAAGKEADGRNGFTTGRSARGPRRITIPAYGRWEGFLTDGGRSVGHAHGARHARDRRRPCQFRVGEGSRRPDLQVGRGKEEPKNSQSNRAGTADKDDRSVGQADRRGRAPHGKNSSRDAHVYGAAHRGEPASRKSWTRCSNPFPGW